MSALSDLINAIQGRLAGTVELAGITVLIEDPENLDTQINEALATIGMLILIGQPTWKNVDGDRQTAEMNVTTEIGIGEVPSVWRDGSQGLDRQLVPGPLNYAGLAPTFVGLYDGLIVGRSYSWTPGASETELDCGNVALTGPGIFVAQQTQAKVDSTVSGNSGGTLYTVPHKVCMDVAQTVTKRIQGFKPLSGFRYLTIHQGHPLPDKKRQLYQVLAATKQIISPNG